MIAKSPLVEQLFGMSSSICNPHHSTHHTIPYRTVYHTKSIRLIRNSAPIYLSFSFYSIPNFSLICLDGSRDNKLQAPFWIVGQGFALKCWWKWPKSNFSFTNTENLNVCIRQVWIELWFGQCVMWGWNHGNTLTSQLLPMSLTLPWNHIMSLFLLNWLR